MQITQGFTTLYENDSTECMKESKRSVPAFIATALDIEQKGVGYEKQCKSEEIGVSEETGVHGPNPQWKGANLQKRFQLQR